jgi:ADP-ribosyl-[dinitrogen reductase] hydrolase
MPLEFKPARPLARLEREMIGGRLPAGSFTDDTEMALALAESLLAHCPLDPVDLAERLLAWYQAGPEDVGGQTHRVMEGLAHGLSWQEAAAAAQRMWEVAAGNGAVMRCWPVTLAHHHDRYALLADSCLQTRLTHPYHECVGGGAYINVAAYELLHGATPADAVACALEVDVLREPLRTMIETAPGRQRGELPNTGWVRHTVINATWALLTTNTFEEALVQAVNLGEDADSTGAVTGMLAGAAYGLEAIPDRWREALRGAWPIGHGKVWREADFVSLADQLVRL